MQVVFYGTSACHLCEQAKELLWPLLTEFNLRLQEVDIADSDRLLEQYSLQIPVLKLTTKHDELVWPFDSIQLRNFLS